MGSTQQNLLEQLEPRFLLSGTPQLNELFAAAYAVDISPIGSIALNDYAAQDGQSRMYQFTTPLTGRLYIDMLADGSDIDSYLEVFDERGRRIRWNDNASRNTKNASTSLGARAGQTFYILAKATKDTEGAYRLRVTSEPNAPPPELFAAAMGLAVSPKGSTDLLGTLGELSGPMMYQVTAAAKGKLTLNLLGLGGGIDTILEVYDDRGRRIKLNDNAARNTTDSKVVLNAREGQTFYVLARAKRGTWGDYRLSVSSVAVDDYADSLETAKLLSLNRNGAAAFSGTINFAGDVDVRYFVATVSGTMTVSLTAAKGSPLSGSLVLYDATGAAVAQGQDDGSGATISYTVQAGQRYYVAAAGQGASAGKYRVTIATSKQASPTVNPLPDDQQQPGQAVTASVVQDYSGLSLIILGTDNADTIVLSQTASGITLTTLSGTQNFQGVFASIVIYGFAGADTIRLMNTVTAASLVYGGDGDDVIYCAAQGADMLYGGEGDDLLVAVGSGADRLYGEGGLDGFWGDSADAIADASSAENAVGAVHKIAQFYQPQYSGPVYGSMPTLEIAGQDLVDPAITGAAAGYRNFASKALFVDGPEYNDIDQGSIGDCYFLASLGSLADTDPALVRQMITHLGDGTYAVRFYRNGQPVYVRVDADLPVTTGGSLAYANLSPDGELWVALMEKAYAFFRFSENSYASLDMGWMSDVNTHLTNVSSQTKWTSTMSADSLFTYIKSMLAAGHAVTAGTVAYPTAQFVGCHAYMIRSVQTVDGVNYVTVYNPWGWDGRTWDSNRYDGLLTVTLADFQASFNAVVASLA